jgi:hypothetical protein
MQTQQRDLVAKCSQPEALAIYWHRVGVNLHTRGLVTVLLFFMRALRRAIAFAFVLLVLLPLSHNRRLVR